MASGNGRRGAATRVRRRAERTVLGDEPLRVAVTDRTGSPVQGALVDALVCGWRAEPPVRGSDDAPVTAGYCQYGAAAGTTGDGVAPLGPYAEWEVVSGTDETRRPAGLPPGVDPGERVGSDDGERTGSGTLALVTADYQGPRHDWFGSRLVSLARLAERSASDADPVAVELRHKRLFGPEPLTIDDRVDGVQADDYEYGAVTCWQTVPPSPGGTHRLSAEVRSGFQSLFLAEPSDFPNNTADEERYPTVDALGIETERATNDFGQSGALHSGVIGFDFLEPDGLGDSRAIEVTADPREEYEGSGRQRTLRSLWPRAQKLADDGQYALTSAVAFELTRVPDGSPARSVPLYPGLRSGFEDWRPPEDDGDGSEGGGLVKNISSLVAAYGGPVGETIEESANYTRGIQAGKFIGGAATALGGYMAMVSLADSPIDEPANDVGSGPPFDPNRSDRVQTSWTFDANDTRIATVAEVPFQFVDGAEATVQLRGLWGSDFKTRFAGRFTLVTDRVSTAELRVDDRRVPGGNGGGSA
jgi:hypothetical protein